MRAASVVLVSAAMVAAACARVHQPLQAIDPTQAILESPNEAQAELEGVTVRAQLGGWHGEPKTLEQRLTPVDVTVHNGSRRVIRVGPEAFTLQTPGGAWRPLTQTQAAQALRDLGERRHRRFGPRIGAAGGPAFPGYDTPGDPKAPWSAAPEGAPTPELGQWYDTQSATGVITPGATTSVVLFFGTAANTLARATFEVSLIDEQGGQVGVVRMPFARD